MVTSSMKTGLLMGFGSFFVVLGGIMVVFWPPLFFNQLKNMMIVTNESMSFEMWKEPPIVMYLECFMFNITNTEDILAGNATTLQVEQLGPYVYRETHYKVNITWNDNSTLSYYNMRRWNFEPEMSNGTLSDEIVSINPIIATVAYTMRRHSVLVNVPVDLFLRYHHSSLFLRANVSSWLFDGIEDPVLDIASHFPDLPFANVPYDKFGWFYTRNNSMEYDGEFVMNTGAEDFSKLGNIEMWRNANRTGYRDDCGIVQGSSGELWAPELGQPEVLIFAPDLCTYMILKKNTSISFLGIEGVEYSADESVFDNGYKNPRMACYCSEVRDNDCLPPGALNVSLCRWGAPAFVSLPHMYLSDPTYPDKITGMHPDPSHRFRLSLEMFTGMPLQVAAQLQINLLVRRVRGISINNILPDADTLVPMFWFRQEVSMSEEYARLARRALHLRYGVVYALYGLTVIGLLLLIVGVVILIRRLLKPTEPAMLTEDTTSE